MRGQIELYTNYNTDEEKLLYQDENVIVDGAGELIADIMTYPTPSLSGVSLRGGYCSLGESVYGNQTICEAAGGNWTETAISSILDASNYTIQAISFGKASKNFAKHAHTYPSSLSNSSTIIAFETNAVKIAVLPYALSGQQYFGVSSYPGGTYLPSYPDPLDRVLEKGSIPPVAYTLSSAFPQLGEDWGQNLNMIPYRDSLTLSSLIPDNIITGSGTNQPGDGLGPNPGIWSPSGMDDTSFISSLGGSAVWLGCYPESSSFGGATSAYMTSSWGGISDSTIIDEDSVVGSGVYLSQFNSASSMDIFGFVGKHYCVNGNIAPAGESNAGSGLIISALENSDGSSLAYMVTIGSGDMGCANLYGGITTAGLWSLDVCKSMQANRHPPPFMFDPISNKRRYKLFSKKVFNENICRLTATADMGNGHKDLTFIWRLFF